MVPPAAQQKSAANSNLGKQFECYAIRLNDMNFVTLYFSENNVSLCLRVCLEFTFVISAENVTIQGLSHFNFINNSIKFGEKKFRPLYWSSLENRFA